MIENPERFVPIFIEAGADFKSPYIRRLARIWTGVSE